MASDLTRLQIVTKVADSMGRSLTGTNRSGATLQSVLEEMYEWSQLKLARAFMFPEMDVRDTTTADTTTNVMVYSYTTLFGASQRTNDIMSLVIEDGTSSVKLTRWLHRRLLKDFPYPEGESTDKPRVYTRVGSDVWLFPVPNATYDIHSVRSKMPTRAAGDSSYSDYEFKDDLLIIGTIVEFFNYMQEFKDAAKWSVVWKTKLLETLSPIVHPTDWEPEGRAFNSDSVTFGDFWKQPLQFTNP